MGIKDISFPFSPESEEDVRVSLALFFSELGYKSEEMSFESNFQIQLGHSIITEKKDFSKQKINGRNDLLLARFGLPLAMVELKAPDVELTEQDRDQGLSYARLIQNMPPYTIVTNGITIQVFDTITTELIESGDPTFSTWWKNGGTYKNLSGVDKEWASKTLISLSLETFKKFSENQVRDNLSNLISTSEKELRFSPSLYVQRQEVIDNWEAFFRTDFLFFGLIGESGAGKTNELCSLVQNSILQKNIIPIFYKGVDLWDGLASKIRNDFNWEFNRDEGTAIILRKFHELAKIHNVKILIFIDGLDETPQSVQILKGELVEISNYLDPTYVRICVTCKNLDWKAFVFERSDQLNNFGKKTFPPQKENRLPGLELDLLSESELIDAWEKYKDHFCLYGEIEGETRELCRFPLTLRLLSETYQNSKETIPSDLSDIAIFNHYWLRKMSDFDRQQQLVMERIISHASQIMVSVDQVEIDERLLFSTLENELSTSPFYNKVFLFGFLHRRDLADGSSHITFPFNKLRHFIYTIKAQQWLDKVGIEERKQEVIKALKTNLGREALFFFLEVDRDDRGWIFPVVENDLSLFLEIALNMKSDGEKEYTSKLHLRLSKLTQFIALYDSQRDNFSTLKYRLAPYSRGNAGLLLSGPFHTYRTRTQAIPELISKIDDQYAGLLFDGKLSEEMEKDLMPDYGSVSNRIFDELKSSTPIRVVYSEIERQLRNLISKQLLDESHCPLILAERVNEILKNKPNIGIEGSPRGKYWNLLGYTCYEDSTTSIIDLINKSHSLFEEWIAMYKKSTGGLKRWYENNLFTVFALQWYLEQLSYYMDSVRSPINVDARDLFSYIYHNGFDKTSEIAVNIAPFVISEYEEIMRHNFADVLHHFETFNALQGRMLIELSEDNSFFKSDYLHLSYIWFPSMPSGPITLRFVKLEESLAEVCILNKKSVNNIFAKNVFIKTFIDGKEIVEERGVISRLRYPDLAPISNQVYQLVTNEYEEVFGSHFPSVSLRSSINYEDVFRLQHGGISDRLIVF